ncbi:MAG: AI-2E family transporter [Pseudomonadota bacterium]
MPESSAPQPQSNVMQLVEGLIRFGLILVILVLCAQVFAPFASVAGLGLILAVALYPLHCALARRLGDRQGLAATVLVVSGLLIIGVPTSLLGGSMAGQANELYTQIESGTLEIPAPKPGVQEWPVIGERLYRGWSALAEDLRGYVDANHTKIQELSRWAVGTAASTVGTILAFLGSLIIAGIIMAFGASGSAAVTRIFSRLSDATRGPRLQVLATATIRSVATGVVGVAFIQALLLGIGFILADIPAPGLLALIALVLGILQVPALLVSLPAIAYVWWAGGDAETLTNILLTAYLIFATLSDNVLKPILLGRGVEAPMPVILIGALGGMVSFGIIGLFTGPVILAMGYVVFMEWVDHPPQPIEATSPTKEHAASGDAT